VQQHREQHFGGVAASIVAWSERQGAEHVVLAGEARALAGVREHLPERVRAKIVGVVSGARYEPTAALVARAEALIRRAAQSREGDQLEAALTEAAKGGQAVDGVERTLEAVNRGAVWQLFVLRDFRDVGHACETCGALQRGLAGRCAYCERETRPVLLDEAIIDRVIAGGGSVTVVDRHAAGLDRRGADLEPAPVVLVKVLHALGLARAHDALVHLVDGVADGMRKRLAPGLAEHLGATRFSEAHGSRPTS
jgi:hypothetical protein